MFVDLQIVEKSDRCAKCMEWGSTIEAGYYLAIPCPECKRLTHANLGVNLPAGCSWAWSGVSAYMLLRQREQLFKELGL